MEYIVIWYDPFDMSDESLNPEDFMRSKEFSNYNDAHKFYNLLNGKIDPAILQGEEYE